MSETTGGSTDPSAGLPPFDPAYNAPYQPMVAPEPPPAPAKPANDQWWRAPWIRLVLAVILFLAGVVVFVTAQGSKAAAGEIFLEGSDSAGTQTFTPSIAEPPPADLAANATETPKPSTDGTIKTSGGSPGLYGGQRNVPSCNAGNLVFYLEGKPDAARPWAAALGINPGDIKAYVATLTPALLRVDTRVTEYQLAGGRATPRQTILQAGTAVLLDRSAFPRVRCAGGNPLGEARPVVKAPKYRGPRWPRFSPTTVIVVTPSPTTTVIILTDVVTGAPFGRIPGSVVIIDVDRPPAGTDLVIVEPGGRATILGRNWPPGTAVAAVLDNPNVNLGADQADGGGNVTVNVVIPRATPVGAHTIVMEGGGFAVPQTIYVIAPAPAPAGGRGAAGGRAPTPGRP